MNIAVVGTGYVGLVAGACFSETGNEVVCVDIDEKKVEALRRGEIPIYEPGLEDLVTRNTKENRLSFTTALQEGVEKSDVIFIAVGTPPDEDGSADLRHVLAVAKGIGKFMNGPKIIVNKSTVPVGTSALVRATISELTSHPFDVVSNPEFLKEGAAIDDFMRPDRVVVGVSKPETAEVMRELYSPFVRNNNPILVMDNVSAEMTKYAANTMLATRISLMNEIANLCERVGADVEAVRKGVGTDTRIGMSFLFPGVGYGGSCFPKDVRALIGTGAAHGMKFEIPAAVESVNHRQKGILVDRMISVYGGPAALDGKTFAVWGLAFKPKTDDVREAPAYEVCRRLLEYGAKLQVFDPEANHTFEESFGTHKNVSYFESNYEALSGANALIICTEWNEFRRPNFDRLKAELKSPVIFDGRNLFDPTKLKDKGFEYHSIGRPSVGV
ncbi:MAG: UDP-glucose/GDP-mannose dehydrogenase family protein [Bdellovibrionales bacterium]|nr:UDP-glucose/GDP-mannose dehydrogenase family protein [Bdellovibrionales bacterium]